ncbi:MAG TPA: VOC family protein [Nitrospira sp.]|nr:VOC family protein [Nitrospira sp.]
MTSFTKARFVIAVPNFRSSAEFYSNVLGFTVRTIGDPGWLVFERDTCVIMGGECPDALPPGELGDHSYFAYIVVSAIDNFYRSVQAKGAELIKNLCDEPWGMREFGVRTPDGASHYVWLSRQ